MLLRDNLFLNYLTKKCLNHGHKCVKPKLHLMEGMDFLNLVNEEPDLEIEVVLEDEECVNDDTAAIASISIQAMVGTPSPKTMRVIGQLKKMRVVILIDTGSTRNFVDTTLASEYGLIVQQSNSMKVKIANGDMVSSE